MTIVSKNNKQIANWLIVGCILVAAMVMVGGITRLTDSGLSMVTWKPVTGTLPPLNETQWQEEFTKYKTSPEYIKKNYDFTLAEFKEIFFWEYVHRLLGRILGIVFLIPFIYFWVKKKIESKRLLKHLIVIFFLGGLQGLIGWYMVKSGLVDNPNVSHYRLALHLVTALFLICYIFWMVLTLRFPKRNETIVPNNIFKLSTLLLVLSGLQIVYGAFVAGLKAGKLHSTFPKMGSEWFPYMISEGFKEKGFIALFEDSYTVIFIHRWLAFVVLGVTVYIILKTRKMLLTTMQRRSVNALLILISVQFLLGVLTIMNGVPMVLGVLHQFVGMLFLVSIIAVLYLFKKVNTGENSIASQN